MKSTKASSPKSALAIGLILALSLSLSACQTGPGNKRVGTVSNSSGTQRTAVMANDAPGESTGENGGATDNAPSGESITLTDALNRSVTLSLPLERVFVLSSVAANVLDTLGGQSMIVGTDSGTYYRKLDQTGTAEYPILEIERGAADVSEIVKLSPDLILLDSDTSYVLEDLEQTGIPVVVNYGSSYEENILNIQLIAQATGLDATAAIAKITDTEKQIQEAVSGLDKPTVYISTNHDDMGLLTMSSKSFAYEIVALCGGELAINKDNAKQPECTLEEILAANPDVVLSCGGEGIAQDFMMIPPFQDLSAVKESRVYPISFTMAMEGGPHVADFMLEIAKLLHPDAFPSTGE